MANKFLDISAPVAKGIKEGSSIVVIETGFFMQLPYPRNLSALRECEAAIWRRLCLPCCVGVVNGRIKAGLLVEDMEALCKSGKSCSRWELPSVVSGGETAAADASAAIAIAKLAGIVPVMAPGLSDSLADMDALAACTRIVFCGPVTPDRTLLFASRGVPVLRKEAGQISDAYIVLRELELSESVVIPCGETLGDMADASCAVALDIEKKTDLR